VKINKYKASNEYRNAVKLLTICKGLEITQRIFVEMRNFFLFNINVRNANRAGVLAEMTVQNFLDKAKAWNMDGGVTQYIITIVDHKTLASSGTAKLVLSEHLNLQMSTFFEVFFTTLHGKPLTDSSAVSQSLSRHSMSVGLCRITSNDCRRSAA